MKFAIKLLLLLAIFQVKAESSVRFQTHISPQAQSVGDVLLITPDKKHWSTIKLDSAPKDGEHIKKQQMMDWLQHQVGSLQYHWQGKTTAIVHQKNISKAVDLLNKAKTALDAQLKSQGYTKVLLNSKTVLKDSNISLSDFIVELPQHHPVAKRVCVRLKYQKHSIPVWFSVKAYQSVLVAQHKIKSHTLAHQDHFALEKRNIAGLKSSPLTEYPKTLWVNQTLDKDQILTQDTLSIQPAIIQGQKVKVSVQQDSITITTEAVAQSDGYIGQSIRMKNLQTNKYFVAMVTGKNQAEIGA